jgi:hypothetical protein
VASSIALGFDYPRVKRLPSLAPLAPLSPAFAVVDQLMQGVEARICGRTERALQIYSALLERLEQTDRAGLDASHHLYTVHGVQCGMGMLEATMGLSSCLERAALIEPHAGHQVNGILVRMLHHLWQGDPRTAAQCKREAELARIQGAQHRVFDGVHLLGEVTAHALAGDLTGVKQVIEEIEQLAQRFPGWVPVLHFARAEHQRLRGDAASALGEIQAALRLSQPGEHQPWAQIAAAHLRVLFDLGRHAEACTLGRQYVATAEREGLGCARAYLKMPLALALASHGAHSDAAFIAQSAIDDFRALGTTGLNLVVAYETRARVAVRAGDQTAFVQFTANLTQHIPSDNPRALLASYERTLKEARGAGLEPSTESSQALATQAEAAAVLSMRTALESCTTVMACARTGLELPLRSTDSSGGLFFSVGPNGPVLQAQAGELAATPEIHALVREYVAAELDSDPDLVTTRPDSDASAIKAVENPTGTRSHWTQANGQVLRPILLGHDERGALFVTGVAVLLPTGRFHSMMSMAAEMSRALHRAQREEAAQAL